MAFKGGRFAEIFKGKGDQRECGLSRSVFLASGVAKQFHRLVRNRLMPYLAEHSPEITCAMGGRGVGTGSHYARLAQDWAGGMGLSSAVIFLDITAAYYTVLRELAVGGHSDEAVVTLLRRLDLPPLPRPTTSQPTSGSARPSPTPGSRSTSRLWRPRFSPTPGA